MPELYQSIPPERRSAYLQNAQEAFEAAAQPVVDPAIEALGEFVIKEAESVAETDAKGLEVPDEAQAFLDSQNSIADEAAKYLEKHDQHIQDQVNNLTSDKTVPGAKLTGLMADKADASGFMAMRREYLPKDAAGRADLAGPGFASHADVMRQLGGMTGIQNQVWRTMIKQHKAANPDQPPKELPDKQPDD